MEIDKAIRVFSAFINVSWEIAIPLLKNRSYTTDESSISDWLQANWEVLVERKVLPPNEYLEIYGDGADYFGASSRMTDIEAHPMFSVKVVLINEEVRDLLNSEILTNVEFNFDKLVSFQNKFYRNTPPFDHVLVQDSNTGVERVLPLKSVKFVMYRT